jgi:hypothetical protein
VLQCHPARNWLPNAVRQARILDSCSVCKFPGIYHKDNSAVDDRAFPTQKANSNQSSADDITVDLQDVGKENCNP